MKKNFLLLPVLSLLCVYEIWTFQKTDFLKLGVLSGQSLSGLVNLSKTIFVFTGIGLFAILMLGTGQKEAEAKQFSVRVWLYGLGFVLGICVVSALIFNPVGSFTWNIDHVVLRGPQLIKSYQYDRLHATPDIVFLGTSISGTILAQEYAQKLSLTGFNFAVKGGSTIDYSTITNSILSRSTIDNKPAVIVTEILSPGLAPSYNGIEFYKKYPVEYAQYMPAEFAINNISRHLDQLFTYTSFPQVIYAEYFIWNKRWNSIPTSNAEMEVRANAPIKSDASYQRSVALASRDLNLLLRCKKLDPQGQNLILHMVALSTKQHVGLVFYRSPINDDFYTVVQQKPSFYITCEKDFNLFMKQIQIENPNVFYVDLSHYHPVSSAGKTFYLDTHHLNSVGSNRVLEVLTPTIQKAIRYTRSQ